ncbi:Rv0909 family putative TA system antitoxin [Microbacterium sp. zg.B48]|uniref:Rv0909 family putative TA system antitoxin n=1 Tax=Microbacterium sp. zg.B48 TaxID=2969408 RepID=UPI00214BF30F|nr:Rv0909 family putative TA system antitoxin [Microbacterium sp. zg.B48]MCR2763234.1 Rv0909 family putative TA system antitoxin [Microbacterium sp. zg.B48]
MGIDDVVNQGKKFLEGNKDKIEAALKSDKSEEISDNALNAAAGFVKKVAPDSVDTHVDSVREKVDKPVGNDR